MHASQKMWPHEVRVANTATSKQTRQRHARSDEAASLSASSASTNLASGSEPDAEEHRPRPDADVASMRE